MDPVLAAELRATANEIFVAQDKSRAAELLKATKKLHAKGLASDLELSVATDFAN